MAEYAEESKQAYGKRPFWQWLLIYLVIGGLIYGLIYFFFLSSGGVSLPTY